MPRTKATTRTQTNTRLIQQNTNSSLFFNGSSSIINVTSPTGYSALTTSFAFGAWIKIGTFLSATNYPSIVYLWGRTTFYIYQQSINFNGNINGTNYNANIGSLNAFKSVYDVWFHLSITYDGTIIYIYINGNLYTTLTTVGGPFTVVNNNLQIGNAYGGAKFIGNMSNFFMGGYMTAQQIKTIYTNNNYSSNTIIQYPLNEGAGSIAYDISGNGNNGTITSGIYSNDVPFKKRKLVNDNLVYNGDFEYAPPFTAVTTTQFRWINGTAGGSNNPGDCGIFVWGIQNITGTAAASYDAGNGNSGNYAMKLSTTATASQITVSQKSNASFLGTTIPAQPSTTYKVSFWLKTNFNSGSATTGANLQVIGLSGDNTTTVQTISVASGIVTTTGWTQYTGTFTTISTVRYLNVTPRVTGNDGTATLIMDAWFDDIVLVPTTTPTRTLIV